MTSRRITLTDGHATSGPGWVYAWLWPDGVRYIGATWLDPAVRTELHLHADTTNAYSLAQRSIGPETADVEMATTTSLWTESAFADIASELPPPGT